MSWFRNIDILNSHLRSLSVRDSEGTEVDFDEAFLKWRDMSLNVRAMKKTVYLIGNGASASMASHVAADLAKNAKIRTEVFSDLSLITAIANDMSYEEVFAEPLRRRMSVGDMLIAISTSGRSPNVLRATEEAKKRNGLVITLSAMSLGNPLSKCGLLNFYVPSDTYGLAETCHAAILHYWLDHVVSSQK